LAMAHDDGPSKMSDISERLTVEANYASQYRRRLIANELIETAGYGLVDFSLPYLRDYLREHPASEAQRLAPFTNNTSNNTAVEAP
jgi:Mn-dependent DtxR family transcriptional regulator